MLQSVQRANDLTALMMLYSAKWSHELAKQKACRTTSLINAKARQEEREETGDFTEKMKVQQNIRAIDLSLNSLDYAYSKLFNIFKNKSK